MKDNIKDLIGKLRSEMTYSEIIDLLKKEQKIEEDFKHIKIEGLYHSADNCEKVFFILTSASDLWSITKSSQSVDIMGSNIAARSCESIDYYMRVTPDGTVKICEDEKHQKNIEFRFYKSQVDKIESLGYKLESGNIIK